MKLMIVESPNKIKKLESILGKDWKVMASVGHIRDLPKNELGIEEPGFKLKYEFIPPSTFKGKTFPGGEERVARIRRELSKADEIYLATDPDREGEAIAWHLKEALGLKESQYLRVTFGSITKSAIQKSLNEARKINYELVYAQEARRALDRIYGYTVSPLISDMLGQSLSAGRVQSPAVRLVVDTERAIKGFKKTNHFGAIAIFDGGKWEAQWVTKPIVTEKFPYVVDESLATRAAGCRQFSVTASEKSVARQSPPPPFSTALLLQAASVSLKLDPDVTAKLAQKLFEQGAITYIGTDSVNFSDEGIQDIRAFAKTKGWSLPDVPRRFKEKEGAQEGHEAIRPTHLEEEQAGEDDNQRALYRLIRQRAIASQLVDATYNVNTVLLKAKAGSETFEFQANGRILVGAGWKALTSKDAAEDESENDDPINDKKVPTLEVGSIKIADSGKVLPKTTRPPSRYTKASLIKKLEAEGIGRPRTFAPIMQNIMGKGYLKEVKRFLEPTEIGLTLIDQLVRADFAFIELQFTRGLEEKLDVIATGDLRYYDVVEPAFKQLQDDIKVIGSSGMMKPRFQCTKCKLSVRRFAPAGKNPFWCCTNPDCKTYMDDNDGKPIERKLHACAKCGKASMQRYKRKKGTGYLWACISDGCQNFMDDENGKPVAAIVHICPKCKTSPLRRFQKKDKDTGKPKGGFAWFCTAEVCKTFLEDEKGKPVTPKIALCPACKKPMFRHKGEYGYWWGCSGYRDGCKTKMNDDRGKPVRRQPRKMKAFYPLFQ